MRTPTTADDRKMPKLEKALYTAKVPTTGGGDGGPARRSGGHLDVQLAVPGWHREGTTRGNINLEINLAEGSL